MRCTIKFGSVAKVLGILVLIEAILLLIPLVTCLIYRESDWFAFFVALVAATVCGGLTVFFTRRYPMSMRSREGFLLTSIVWIIFAIFGMIPFRLCLHPLGVTDSFFESLSGFTTTGSTVIPDVEIMSHGILLWRSLMQWIGGLGIILFMLAVLPGLNQSGGLFLFNAEATGIVRSKLHPRIRQTSISLWLMYVLFTFLTIILFLFGPMDFFDAVCMGLTTVSTGGFTTHNEGFLYWHSDYLMLVIMVITFLAGLNFFVIYRAATGHFSALTKNVPTRMMLKITLIAYVLYLISAYINGHVDSIDDWILYPMFQALSTITSTGFQAPGSAGWGAPAVMVTMILMLIESCAGSTSGGIKIDRVIVLWENIKNELRRKIYPKRTYVVTLNQTSLGGMQLSRMGAFISLYLLITLLCGFAFACFGYNLLDSVFMSISAMGCSGIGYGATADGFYMLATPAKWIFMGEMLIGRLEVLTVLVIFLPSFWKR